MNERIKVVIRYGGSKDFEKIQKIFKKMLLYLIENDKDVQKALSENNRQNAVELNDKHKLQEYEEKIRNLDCTLNEKEDRIVSLNNYKEENINLKDENRLLQNKVRLLENEKEDYENKYQKLDDIYTKYCSIDTGVAESFKAIVNTSSPLAFLLSFSDIDNLKLFYEKICMEWKGYDDETLNVLNLLFDFAFEQYTANNTEYHRIITNIGEDFDLDVHTRTSDSPPVGKIKRVIIRGYENETGNKKIKSYVEIG